MTIKKQFIILAVVIVLIPLVCSFYNSLEHYLRSSERFLMHGTKEIKRFDTADLSKKDIQSLFETLRILPPDVEAVVITQDDKIIFTSIPCIKITSSNGLNIVWDCIAKSSDHYFYQFTTINLKDQDVALVTRILRKKNDNHKPKDLMKTIISVLLFFVAILTILLIIMSRTIFRSIIKIEDTTMQLANGNLRTKVTPENKKGRQNEITSILESLEKMRVALLEEQNRKNRFIMGISHDLRTPVAIIKGYTEAITDGVITDKEEINNTLQLIHVKSNQLEDMINSLINFIKMNDSMIRENLITSSITDIIKDFATEAEITANVFKRKIITEINLDKDIQVSLNKQLVNRVFENIFSNALRYTKDFDEIHIKSYYDENNVYLIIKDSGIGIGEEDLKYIFDMFYRGTNSRQEEGMGIGLSVVKNIIETHGWDIEVESQKGFGSSFKIIIPYKKETK